MSQYATRKNLPGRLTSMSLLQRCVSLSEAVAQKKSLLLRVVVNTKIPPLRAYAINAEVISGLFLIVSVYLTPTAQDNGQASPPAAG